MVVATVTDDAKATTKPPDYVYAAMDREFWCDQCSAHCAILLRVYHLTIEGVADRGPWVRCFICGDWRQR